jgi:hypothetical protein
LLIVVVVVAIGILVICGSAAKGRRQSPNHCCCLNSIWTLFCSILWNFFNLSKKHVWLYSIIYSKFFICFFVRRIYLKFVFLCCLSEE